MAAKKPARVPDIRLTVEIPVPPARVFKALTDAKDIRAWSGSPGRVAPRVGGRMWMWEGWNTGKVLACRRPSTLAYTWRGDDWPAAAKDSVVRWKLAASRHGTRVTMVHTGLPSLKEQRDHRGGWKEYFLGPMGKYLEKRG